MEGGSLIAITSFTKARFLGYFKITENELCREHQNHKKTLSWSPRKFVYCCAFNHSFVHNILFFTKAIFIKELSKIFKDFCGKFKDFLRISHNFSIFKDFLRPMQTMVSQFWMTVKYYFAYSNRFRSVKCSKRAICLRHFDGIVPSLACSLTKQHGIRGGKYLLKTSGNTISETLIFKMSLQYMPRPSRTCAFGASYKAAYYSLSACYLKIFWQPCLLNSDLSTG